MPRYSFTALFGLFLVSFNIFANEPVVRISTNLGDIDIKLYPQEAPETVQNFLQYVDSGEYSETLFHRVIDNFMIQGGGFSTSYEKKTTADPILNESTNGLSNKKGTIAMARTGQPHSATSQFFINVRNNSFLDFAMIPAKGANTLRRSQLGIRDPETGMVTTEDCHGSRITRDSLKKASTSAHDDKNGYICLMQSILQSEQYSLDAALSTCLGNLEQLKQDNKIQPDETCSSYVNKRHEDLQLVYMRWGYTVFGKVINGMDVVNTIKQAPTGAVDQFSKDAPLDPVIIQSVQRLAN